MVNLSDRLRAIADEVETGQSVADVGTDHGLLPLALWEEGRAGKVVMTDVSASSLEKAAANCRLFHPEADFDLRVGDGLTPLRAGEADVLILAGMGGILMTEILGADTEKAGSFAKLILQPRNHVGILRHWLYNNGFSIAKEKLVREGRFICEIIVAIPKEVAVIRSMGPERIEYEYPHSLLKFAGPLTEEYLRGKLQIEKDILAGMEKARDADPRRLRSQRYRIEYIERLVKQL